MTPQESTDVWTNATPSEATTISFWGIPKASSKPDSGLGIFTQVVAFQRPGKAVTLSESDGLWAGSSQRITLTALRVLKRVEEAG